MTPPTQTAEIPVHLAAGDDCESCAGRLFTELSRHRGVVAVEPVGTSAVRVAYDPEHCSLSCVTQAADTVGATLARRYHHEILRVEGMDCYDCAQTIERAALRMDGATACSVNFAAARMRVEYDVAAPDFLERLRNQVSALGYRIPIKDETGVEAEPRGFLARRKREVQTGAAVVAMLTAVAASAYGADAIARALYVIAVVAGGWTVARSGVAALRATRRPDINILMTIAVIGAGAIGAWLEAALVVVLFSIGSDLERYAVARSRRSLSELLALAPESARVLRGTDEVEVPASDLVVSDVVVVRPGERISADGVVVAGSGAVDQAPITGEAIPVDKTVGDEVFAGTFNGEGRLEIRVDRAPGDSTLARIGRAVAEAQAQRSPAERWVDRFARVYTPIVMGVALATAVFPALFGFGSFADWLYRGLAFLILACPCALVIATPVAVVSALARASAAGVLVKGGAYLEAAASVRAVAFDKTGTLTAGRPRVTKILPLGAHTDAQLLRLAATLESGSEHPLARAIVEEAERHNVEPGRLEAFEAMRGSGVEGTVDGSVLRLGKPAAFSGHPRIAEAAEAIGELEREGRTVVVVGSEDQLAGVIGIDDAVRTGAREGVAALGRVGVKRTVLLTGDHAAAAQRVMREAGVDDVRPELLPEEKVAALEELQAEFGATAMVGDGVNDAPALARSSLGIAMGSAGSPTAIETADVALMGEDIGKVAGLIGLSRWTAAVVRQNIAFSLGVKVVAAVLALAGLLTLWMAVLADVGATLMVVANGLRLLRSQPLGGGLRRVPLL